MRLLLFGGALYDEDASLVEQVHRQRHHEQCENIGGRGDDGCHDEYDDDGVAAVAAHKACREEAKPCKEPRENRNLEYDAHREAQHDERRDVRIERNHIGDLRADLVRRQEAECQRKYQKVTQHHAQRKHRVAARNGAHDIAAFVAVERGRNEAEELVDDVGRCAENARKHSHPHVNQKLLRQPRVDERHGKCLALLARQCSERIEQSVGRKVAVRGRKHECEELLLKAKRRNTAHESCRDNPYDDCAQLVEMLPKRLIIRLVGHRVRYLVCSSSPLVGSSFSISFMPSLNERTPLPMPFISSGIFLPPNSNSTISTINMISGIPSPNTNGLIIVVSLLLLQRYNNLLDIRLCGLRFLQPMLPISVGAPVRKRVGGGLRRRKQGTKKPDLVRVGLLVSTAEGDYATAVEMRNVAATVKIAYNSGNAAKISVLPITS